jgi:K+-sensing histidine kinase KdpD
MSASRLHSRSQRLAADFAVAVLAIAATGTCAVGFHRLSGITPSASLFSCAVMLVAWSRGIAPAVLAIALAIMIFDYFFLEPRYTLVVQNRDLPQLIFFAVGALLVALICHSERTSKRALREVKAKSLATEARAAELERELALLVKNLMPCEALPAEDLQSPPHDKSDKGIDALEVKIST